MLEQLTVENFAIISRLTLGFEQGLNVFSGETGAGKSIVIEALGFVLGNRGDTSSIKDNTPKMCVRAQFATATLPQEAQKEFLIKGTSFTLQRELDTKGKGKAFVDGRPVTVGTLSAIGRHLVDFHGQHEHQSLLHPCVHLTLLDQFAKLDPLLAKFRTAYEQVKATQALLDTAHLSEQEKERLLDMYAFQLKEINALNPTQEEDTHLDQTLPKLKHAGKLQEGTQSAYDALYGAEPSAAELAGKAAHSLTTLAELDEALSPLADKVSAALAAMEEAAHELASYKDDMDLNPDTLDELISRHEKYKRLKAKYGPTISDVLNTQHELQTKLENLQNSEQKEQDLTATLAKYKGVLLTLCQELHDKRFTAAQKLAKQITQEIKPLGFHAVSFSVSVEMDEENPGPLGADHVEFLFSPNPGSALKPLKNIASGGETSRVMLGLKTVLAPTVPIMVFDEVDAGIGGATGVLVGQKLRTVAEGRQVLCVTHLAQVAAHAGTHYHVTKTAQKNTTEVQITRLENTSRTAEIARMLGGNGDASSAAYRHAEELLKQTATH